MRSPGLDRVAGLLAVVSLPLYWTIWWPLATWRLGGWFDGDSAVWLAAVGSLLLIRPLGRGVAAVAAVVLVWLVAFRLVDLVVRHYRLGLGLWVAVAAAVCAGAFAAPAALRALRARWTMREVVLVAGGLAFVVLHCFAWAARLDFALYPRAATPEVLVAVVATVLAAARVRTGLFALWVFVLASTLRFVVTAAAPLHLPEGGTRAVENYPMTAVGWVGLALAVLCTVAAPRPSIAIRFSLDRLAGLLALLALVFSWADSFWFTRALVGWYFIGDAGSVVFAAVVLLLLRPFRRIDPAAVCLVLALTLALQLYELRHIGGPGNWIRSFELGTLCGIAAAACATVVVLGAARGILRGRTPRELVVVGLAALVVGCHWLPWWHLFNTAPADWEPSLNSALSLAAAAACGTLALAGLHRLAAVLWVVVGLNALAAIGIYSHVQRFSGGGVPFGWYALRPPYVVAAAALAALVLSLLPQREPAARVP